MSTMPTFDVCGELPTGTTVLEASAGTGKTFTIAALATRYVAEGRAELRELMLVTFGRAATQELRERVRERLVDTERRLADPPSARAGGDSLVRHLAAGPDDEVALRRRRLATALADFDVATIATTHGFCQQMLTGLGVAGDFEPDGSFVESIDDLVVEVVDDLYVRRYGRPAAEPPQIRYRDAVRVVRQAVADRHAALVPTDADPGSIPALREGIAREARAEVQRRKRRRRLRDYDDLLTRLRDALADPVSGPAARARIRDRYRVVLVDEFQDTDPVQWQILRLAFAGSTTMILIGDPKQAIYAFRGGDVVTYLGAVADASDTATLGRNQRSDAALLGALDRIFRGAALGHPDIVVRPVESAHPDRRLSGAPVDAPLRLRVARRDRLGARPGKLPPVDRVRDVVAADVAADVAGLLAAPTRLTTAGAVRPVAPGDVAVLVHTNKQADLVRAALIDAAVPAVLTGAVNIFATEMATQWLILLQALEQPHRAVRARTAALGSFVGWSAAELAAAGDDAMDTLGPRLREWSDVLAARGVPALLELVLATGLPARLLATPAGERQLTDLRHLAETMHTTSVAEGLGTAALVEWLQRRIAVASSGDDVAEERTRRLDSDAAAVQVVTVHRSKGLQFPVVYVPFGWDRWQQSTPDLLRLHDVDGRRLLDVGGAGGSQYAEHRDRHETEDAGETLRLLYVALTRAQCQVVTWWAPSHNTTCSPTHRLLFGEVEAGQEPPARVPVPDDESVGQRLTELAAGSAAAVVVEEVPERPAGRWGPPAAAAEPLSAAVFDRRLDAAWRRTSYTALTASAHEADRRPAGVSSEPTEPVLDDETDPGAPGAGPLADQEEGAEPLRQVRSPMHALPAGAGFGIVVHSVLERVDTAAVDLGAELALRSREVLDRRLGSSLDPGELGAALLPALETPLGPLAGGLRLRDVAPADRLAELDFELPLAGGDDPTRAAATVRAIAGLLRRELPADDRFAGYPARLDALDDQTLRGYLVGSLDAVLRVRGPDGEPAYLVADYKTNWLGGGSDAATDGPLSAWHYRPAALTDAMLAAHYPLQLVLYLVALHRYLRWRQPGYDPDRHLAGGLYLFLRGMCGPATPVLDGAPCGVFGWRPPAGLVTALSRLLAGGVG